MKSKFHRMFQTFAVFLLGLTFLHPISICAEENSDSSDPTTENSENTGTQNSAQNRRLKAGVKFQEGTGSLPANIEVKVTATLTAVDDVPMLSEDKASLIFNGAGENYFEALPFDQPGTFQYRLTYTLETNSNRVSIHHGNAYLITVEVLNHEPVDAQDTQLFDWYYFVSPITEDSSGSGEEVEPVKVGDSSVYLQYQRPTTPTDPDDPDDPTNPSFPNLPDTNKPNTSNPSNSTNVNNNPSINLPNTSNPGTTTNNTTTTSTPNITKPNTATETNLMTYLIGIVVSGGLMIFFLLLARRKAEEN
ncbi:hypothetical protein AAK899_12445 [Erysipelotrichaceae bacterium 51-3]